MAHGKTSQVLPFDFDHAAEFLKVSGLKYLFLILIVLMLAYGLRLHGVNDQSIWGDEGASIHAGENPSLSSLMIYTASEGTNPPLPYLILNLWMRVAGKSILAMRYTSIIASLLTVAAVAGIGKKEGGVLLGLIAGILIAIAPYHIYYAQELRAYAESAMWISLSYFLFIHAIATRWSRGGALRLWGGFAVFNALALLTHYFGAFALLAQSLYGLVMLGIGLRARHNEPDGASLHWVGWWIASYVVTALLMLPWIMLAWSRTLTAIQDPAAPFHPGIEQAVMRIFSVFSLGSAWEFPETFAAFTWQLTPYLVLLMISIIGGVLAGRRHLLLLLLWLLIPCLLVYQIGFPGHGDWTRYFIAASPAFSLLLGQGVVEIVTWVQRVVPAQIKIRASWLASAIGIAPLLILPLSSMYNYYTNPAYGRPDNQGLVARIMEIPDHAVINERSADNDIFFIYYTNTSTRISIFTPCEGSDEKGMAVQLERALSSGYKELWLFRRSPSNCDPTAYIPRWLAEHAYTAESFWLDGKLYTRYLNSPDLPVHRDHVGRIGQGIELRSWAVDRTEVMVGDRMSVSLTWATDQPLTSDLHVFVFLANAEEQVAALRDSVPVDYFRPTASWVPGELVIDHHGLVINSSAVPGEYWLGVGLYDAASGQRLPITEGESWLDNRALKLIPVRIVPSTK